jgi:hypothetical protein
MFDIFQGLNTSRNHSCRDGMAMSDSDVPIILIIRRFQAQNLSYTTHGQK